MSDDEREEKTKEKQKEKDEDMKDAEDKEGDDENDGEEKKDKKKDKAPKKKFEVKKWNAVALWAWGNSFQQRRFLVIISSLTRSCLDIVVDNCAICRNHIMDLCMFFKRKHFSSVFLSSFQLLLLTLFNLFGGIECQANQASTTSEGLFPISDSFLTHNSSRSLSSQA
jgi:RING-box protein 1